MALLSATDISLSYGHQTLLDHITFAIQSGEKVGLVGRNGCGKSSLLKILTGEEAADSGHISQPKDLRVGYLPQEFELDPNQNVEQNIASGAADILQARSRYENGDGTEAQLARLQNLIESTDGWNLEARIQSLASSLGVPALDSSLDRLSGGEKRRIALCRALLAQPDLLFLDEPTNHLDAESITWLEELIRNFRGAVIFVTHDRYFLDHVATRILEIEAAQIYSHDGNYSAYLQAKAVRQQIAQQAENKRQRFLKTELEWVRSGVKARGTKQRSRLDAYQEVADQEGPEADIQLDLLIPPAPKLGNVIIDTEDAGIAVGDNPPRWLFQNLNLNLQANQCTGIIGRNGAGKSTLINMLLGNIQPTEGKATIGNRVVVNYVDQTRELLVAKGSLLDEIGEGKESIQFGDQTLSVRAYLRRFGFTDERINERVDLLSGGERARLLLAKVLKKGGNLIVLDEPTNDLDLATLRILEEALLTFQGTVLVVSHDRYFLDRICDQILAFEENGLHLQPGNYSYYLEKRQQRQQAQAAHKSKSNHSSQPKKNSPAQAEKPKRRPGKLSNKERAEYQGMEDKILSAEARIEELQAQLADPQYQAQHYDKLNQHQQEIDQLQAQTAQDYDRWAELEAILEGTG